MASYQSKPYSQRGNYQQGNYQQSNYQQGNYQQGNYQQGNYQQGNYQQSYQQGGNTEAGYGQSAYGQSAPSGYGSNPYNQGGQQGMEMSQMQNGGYSQPSTQQVEDPQYILNECRTVTDETGTLRNRLADLQAAQTRSLNDPNNSGAKAQLESQNAAITTEYKSLIHRLKFLKSRPGSANPMNAKQIGFAERSLKDAWQNFQTLEADYRRKIREQMERQYRITQPDASEDEVKQAVQDPNMQIFSQALMSSNRRGESRTILSNVQQRHNDIQRIEQQMTELATLFQQMQEQVVQQEAAIEQNEVKAEETYTHMEQGNVHMGKATDSARAARKKKWICLGLSIAIVVVIVIVVVIALAATGALA